MNSRKLLAIVLLFAASSCNSYLDVIPDNIATIDNAFTLRSTAEKYLFTCYSHLPRQGSQYENPGFQAGDELWHYSPTVARYPIQIARGNQNIIDPLNNYWDGGMAGRGLFNGIRDCNIFLDNIDKVKEMTIEEKDRWRAEVKFLKAYYNYWLLRMYGPIPLIHDNLPVSADPEEVKVFREPVDSCVNAIVNLLDEAAGVLPAVIDNRATELGRITRPIALAVKAKVLMLSASPLFNGNPDYAGFTDKQGVQLFNPTFEPGKWEKAAQACREAIEACHAAAIELYDYAQEPASALVSPVTAQKMSIRNSIAKKWNTEVVWGNPNSNSSGLQIDAQARFDASNTAQSSMLRELSPTMKMAEMFYTANGVPIDEDKTWDYEGRYQVRTATDAEKYDLRPDYQTAALHFGREPRFYASLGFDGGTWYGQGRNDDEDMYYVQGKSGQPNARQGPGKYSITGYLPKKLVNVESIYPAIPATIGYQIVSYPWPVIRLADLYLLYAEALNETNDRAEALVWINKVRERAGLNSVEASWTEFSVHPDRYSTQSGLREIIHRERAIELAFEGKRYWDLRRWKKAMQELNSPVRGWDVEQGDAAGYYRPVVIFNQTFQLRDYLWPIKEQDLIVNKNLVQNPGW